MTDRWPDIPYEPWKESSSTLHQWLQIVGKFRLANTPWVNHSWHVPLYLTSRGLTTSPIPYGVSTFQIDFDFIDHRAHLATSGGGVRSMALRPMSVAAFYAELFGLLAELGISVRIHGSPNEVPDPIPFAEDETHHAYDADAANRFWRILVRLDLVFKDFRAKFIGKSSPVHFFWGSFDLAVTRFSGRTAPDHPGGIPNLPNWVAVEAYSHEVSSAGFWPGGGPLPEPVIYSYAYPEPEGFRTTTVEPAFALVPKTPVVWSHAR